MGGIKNATEKRKREQLINFENIAAKQMKREGQNFSEKERFMTESYLRMLEENKQFELNDKQKEEWNKSHSAFNKVFSCDFSLI